MTTAHRTARALAAIAVLDRHPVSLCPHCEGLLLCAAAGRPLPLVRTEGGALFDAAEQADDIIDALLRVGAAAS